MVRSQKSIGGVVGVAVGNTPLYMGGDRQCSLLSGNLTARTNLTGVTLDAP